MAAGRSHRVCGVLGSGPAAVRAGGRHRGRDAGEGHLLSAAGPAAWNTPKPAASNQNGSGGFLDPIEGTLLLTAIGIALAAPTGVAVAVWLTEYRRPAALARAVESGIEMIAGVPSVVLAFFGLLVFARPALAFLSQTSAGGAVYGRSFFAAGAMMSLLALPLVVAATREGLAQIPAQMREASYALGKTRATTIRRVLLPSIRPSIASGATLGMGRHHRRHGDRGDPAGQLAAPGRRGRRAGALDLARNGRDADELRV